MDAIEKAMCCEVNVTILRELSARGHLTASGEVERLFAFGARGEGENLLSFLSRGGQTRNAVQIGLSCRPCQAERQFAVLRWLRIRRCARSCSDFSLDPLVITLKHRISQHHHGLVCGLAAFYFLPQHGERGSRRKTDDFMLDNQWLEFLSRRLFITRYSATAHRQVPTAHRCWQSPEGHVLQRAICDNQ